MVVREKGRESGNSEWFGARTTAMSVVVVKVHRTVGDITNFYTFLSEVRFN